MSEQSLTVAASGEQNAPRTIADRVKRPADPLQEMARYQRSHGESPNWRQRWFRSSPELRLGVAACALAPLLLACAVVAAGIMAR